MEICVRGGMPGGNGSIIFGRVSSEQSKWDIDTIIFLLLVGWLVCWLVGGLVGQFVRWLPEWLLG